MTVTRRPTRALGVRRKINVSRGASPVPLCKGSVKAGNPSFRRSLDRRRAKVDVRIDRPQPDALLGVDIFYDFMPVLGERSLARSLRDHAVAATARSPLFLRLLAEATGRAAGRRYS